MREAMEVILRGNMYDLQNNHLAHKRREGIYLLSGGKDERGRPEKKVAEIGV